MLTDAGFRVREPILYGSWSGRENTLSFQDVVVARPLTGVSPEGE
jgi:hypothetical protein